jgi:hypothetical protein
VKLVRATARVARWFAYAAAFAGVLLAIALYDEGWKLAVALAAIVPAVVLFLFSTALTEAAALPARLRGAPQEAAELRASLTELGSARRGGLFRPLWRTGRAALGARELVTPWAPLVPLLNLPFLAATLLSALVTPLLVLLALLVLAIEG